MDIMKKKDREIKRVTPDFQSGLTSEQVKERLENGYSNIVKDKVEKSYGRILFDNFFNSFNVVLISIAMVFLFFIIYLYKTGNQEIADKSFGFSKFTFLIPVFLNSSVSTFQEIRSKKTIKKLKILNEGKTFVIRDGKKQEILTSQIVIDDILFLIAGKQIPADCVLLSGEMEVDESLLTGESDLIKKKSGDILYSGSIVVIGSSYCRVEKVGKETFSSQLSEKVRKLSRHKSELMTNIYSLIKSLSIVLLIVVFIVIATLCYKVARWGNDPSVWGENKDIIYSLSTATTWSKIMLTAGAFAIGVIPSGLILMTTLSLAVSIISLAKQKTMVQELFSLENLSRVDTICLDKTGTLTDGTLKVEKMIPYLAEQEAIQYIKEFNFASSDENQTSLALKKKYGKEEISFQKFIPFSSKEKKSEMVLLDGHVLRLGAPDYLLDKDSKEYQDFMEEAKQGKRVIAFLYDNSLICLFVLEDNIRISSRDTISFFYKNHVDVKIISGDNLATVQKIAQLCGVKNTQDGISLENVSLSEIPSMVDKYTIFSRVSPEQKQAIVEALQSKNHKVAMTGDGINDILALRKANASISFSNATDAAKSCADVVLLDNDFSHLKEVVSQGRKVVNSTERNASLFLMKTFAISLLSVFLIPFKRGQMWFSFENIYLMQTCVIAIGGLFLSFEKSEKPITGTFKENVFPRALLSSCLIVFAVLIPILLNQIPLFFKQTSIIKDENVSTLISVMTTLAGFVVLLSMCIPFTKYRVIVLSFSLFSAILLGFAFPTSYIGGKATTFTMISSPDGNFLHSQLFKEFFQPWNSHCIQILFEHPANFIVMLVFFCVCFPTYWSLMKKMEQKKLG